MCVTRQRLRDAISGRELSGAQTLYLVVDARAKFERAHSMWRERASVHEFLPRAFDPPGRGNAPRGSRPAGGDTLGGYGPFQPWSVETRGTRSGAVDANARARGQRFADISPARARRGVECSKASDSLLRRLASPSFFVLRATTSQQLLRPPRVFSSGANSPRRRMRVRSKQ